MNETWFHIDMDAFFAAIEQRDHPEWLGKPVIVGALPGHRGVVSTCSYEARKYGIHSAMPISQAFRLCPKGIYTTPRMAHYQAVSAQIMTIFNEFTPRLIQVSVDEAFLDLSGTKRLLGPPNEIARQIKARVKSELNLTLSIGIASNKFLAKIASGFIKPDGLTIVPEGLEADFIIDLPLNKLWGLGKKTLERMHELKIDNVASLRSLPLPLLRGTFGSATGEFLFQACRGIDPGIYEGETRQHSLSSEHTFEHDVKDKLTIERTIFDLCNHIMFRLLEEHSSSQVLFLKIRMSDFSTFSIQRKVGHQFNSIEEVFDLAITLLLQKWDGSSPIRLIGLGFDQVSKNASSQMNLFEDPEARRARVEQAIMGIRGKFTASAIKKASLIEKPEIQEGD